MAPGARGMMNEHIGEEQTHVDDKEEMHRSRVKSLVLSVQSKIATKPH